MNEDLMAPLDEAQAAKNATTARAGAVRRLQADHRLALSGTPIENHLGELWTMFQFLNPDLFGPAARLRRLFGDDLAPESEAQRRLLARAVRPFILRRRLDRLELSYEYLDGGTRDREVRVDRFQKAKACRLFLISLKAGGAGLNLTAANRIFLLDPWWNPAVEAKAG